MSFNALSLATLGVGFGALAVASIGLLAPQITPPVYPPQYAGGSDRSRTRPVKLPRRDTDAETVILFSDPW